MTHNFYYNAGSSILFDGSNDYLEIANQGDGVANLNPGHDEAWSLSAWIKPSSTSTWRAIFANQESSSPYTGWCLTFAESGKLSFTGYDDSGAVIGIDVDYNDGGAYPPHTWINVVATYDGSGNRSGLNVYVDGTLQEKANRAGTVASITALDSGEPIWIGRVSWGSYFSGDICHVGFWSKELTAPEAREIYNGRNGARGPGDLNRHSAASNLVSWWIADNASDTYNGTIYDAKGSFNMTPNNLASDAITDRAP
tara:strand:- start:27520 stop:28281 length:762 start_codon:yes stop_codon:yes gene_type:complete